mgnify:CR=1 FL=1
MSNKFKLLFIVLLVATFLVAFFSAHPGVLDVNAQVRQRATPAEVSTELAWRNLAA